MGDSEEPLLSCTICPRNCHVNRTYKRGFCGANNQLEINLYQLHFGEEPVISGVNGSGTIFFCHCNLHCVYCQNFTISNLGKGYSISVERLAEIMLELQSNKAENINLVTPTHYAYLIKKAILLAKKQGLTLPIVWNSNAYESVQTLQDMEEVVDIYLPDFRYFDDSVAKKYSSGVSDYIETAKNAILEMYRQVGNLKIDEGVAYRGLLLRVLLLPDNINHVEKILQWIADAIGNVTHVSLMSQYYPTYLADRYPEINRPVYKQEYDYIVHLLEGLGFENGYIQELGITPEWTPNFSNDLHD